MEQALAAKDERLEYWKKPSGMDRLGYVPKVMPLGLAGQFETSVPGTGWFRYRKTEAAAPWTWRPVTDNIAKWHWQD